MVYRIALVLCFIAGIASHAQAYSGQGSKPAPRKAEKILLSKSASDAPVKSDTRNTIQLDVAHHAATSATAFAMITSMVVIAYAFSNTSDTNSRPVKSEGLLYLRVLFRSLISRQGP